VLPPLLRLTFVGVQDSKLIRRVFVTALVDWCGCLGQINAQALHPHRRSVQAIKGCTGHDHVVYLVVRVQNAVA
jgi:hypothetical protein